MHTILRFALITGIVIVSFMPSTVFAGCFDGTGIMVCSLNEVNECDFGKECEKVNLEDIQAPPFLQVDFKKMKISPAGVKIKSEERSSKIMHKDIIDKKLILQGAEDGIGKTRDGAGWTMVIAQDSGTMMLSVAGETAVFIASGNCICK